MTSARQAYVDPDALRAFARELSTLAAKISDQDRDMQRELSRLGETFRDQEYEKFRAHFQASRHKLVDFAEEVRKFVAQLNQDIEHLAASQRITLDV